MNAGGVLNTCKSNGPIRKLAFFAVSGGWVSNAWVTCLIQRDNTEKFVLIPYKLTLMHVRVRKALAV